MHARLAGLTILLAAGTASAEPVSRATLVSIIEFADTPAVEGIGYVELTVTGTGEIGDACDDAMGGLFVASYVGDLELAGIHRVSTAMFPAAPTITTPSGCEIHDLHVDHVTRVEIAARIGTLRGKGSLTFDSLAVDADDLETGAFDKLYATIVFSAP